MDILFATRRLEKRLSSQAELVRTFGAVRAKVLRRRLDQLRAADNLAVLRSLPGRCHELTQDRKGQLAIDLDGPNRLIFEPADSPPPAKDNGGLDWERVVAIRVLEVEDYHG
ncbi:MAG TPA: killer suppression protein [Thermoanaerobaculia bacterium]|nr:killer suppression protein [Thermoanaerobaculia bacterium]